MIPKHDELLSNSAVTVSTIQRPYTVDTSSGTGGDADMSSTLANIAEHASSPTFAEDLKTNGRDPDIQ